MYSIRITWVGKTQEAYIKQGIDTYLKKLKPYVRTEILELKPAPYKSLSIKDAQYKETTEILKKLDLSESCFFLDERGKELSSLQFAGQLERLIGVEQRRVNFIVGGAYGFEQSLLPASSRKLRLSSMTLTHQMIRLLLTEQVYRAFNIIHGTPYHHE